MKAIKCNSDYFSLYEIGEGCYAAIEKPRQRTGSNAGFVDLGDKIIVFDTFLSLDAAHDLLRCIKKQTGRKPDLVVNSHEHSDHYVGNQVFEAPIISTENTLNAFVKFQATLDEVAELPDDWIQKRHDEIKREGDEYRRKNLENELNFIYNMKNKGVIATPPTEIIMDSMKIEGRNSSATLHIVENAHTPSDIYMTVDDQKICYTGDLLFSECYPWIGSGDPINLNTFMKKLIKEDFDYYVPGHGPLATKKEADLQNQYIDEILELATDYRARNQDINEIKTTDLSQIYANWDDMVFRWNNNFLSSYLST